MSFPYFCRNKIKILLKSLLLMFFTAFLFACKQNEENGRYTSVHSAGDFNYRKLPANEREFYKAAAEHMYDSILEKHNFNGSILVAKNGEILLEDYQGYSNFITKESITASTAFHLASVSKTFTGMAIMKLWEENKLSLDDSLQSFFPGFPYPGITVRMLLSHRSGLPNYVYFMTQDPGWRKKIATNNDMLQFMIDKKPALYGYPDRGFHYCNTNFSLLALIVEKVSGQTFPEYMKNTIFTPLGMTHTFIFSKKDSADYQPSYQPNNRPFPLEPVDCIYGDKNVYSTVRDMFLWDQAIYDNKVVSQATYAEATKPYSLERPSMHNYGLGWRLMMLPNSKIIYHNGWWHGNNTVFTRLVDDTATIIILSNRFNKAIYSGMKIGTVFTNSKKAEPAKPLD